MESIPGTEPRSTSYGIEIGDQCYQFNEELQRLMAVTPPVVSGDSFTALLELPATQAMELIHSAGNLHDPQAIDSVPYVQPPSYCPTFPSNAGLIERAAKYSVFATAAADGRGGRSGRDSPESSSTPSGSELNPVIPKVKHEPPDTGLNPKSPTETPPDPAPDCVNQNQRKRKERQLKDKGSSKKSRTENSDDGEKLPYVHVRARRGQATDSHSLAERVF